MEGVTDLVRGLAGAGAGAGVPLAVLSYGGLNAAAAALLLPVAVLGLARLAAGRR